MCQQGSLWQDGTAAEESTTWGDRRIQSRLLHFDFTSAICGGARLPLLRGRQRRALVATPRRLQGTASAPTRRTIGDFGTSVAFCTDLNKDVPPQGSTVEGAFTCLAMGYPADWVDSDGEEME